MSRPGGGGLHQLPGEPLVNVFIGLSVGTSIQVARHFGAQSARDVRETVHTAITLSLVSGVALIFIGFFLSRPMLELMDTPGDVLDMATTYMRIYFAGMPVVMLYNFGSAVLRAVGDTRRPLYFLMLAGALNVVMNLFFVIVCGMDVDGVALATVHSQCVSAGFIVRSLMRSQGSYRLELKALRIYRNKLFAILRTGLPAGIQGALFSVSNVLIQSSVNSFGSVVMAGNAAAANLEYHRGGGHRLRHDPSALCGGPGVPLRLYGYHGGRPAGAGLFGDAHDRLHPGGLRLADSLDLHGVCPGPYPRGAVPFLPGFLDGYGPDPPGLLPGGAAEGDPPGAASVGGQPAVGRKAEFAKIA